MHMREGKVIVVGGQDLKIDNSVLRNMKGPLWGQSDGRFFLILMLSLATHVCVLWGFSRIKISAPGIRTIEQIPERFARLIIDKPIVRDVQKAADKRIGTEPDKAEESTEKATETTDQKKTGSAEEKQKAAKQSVAMRAQKVEKKIRNVGVLGLLTGTGKTASRAKGFGKGTAGKGSCF